MKEVKEIKINVPEGQLISVEVKDGVCTLRFEVAEEMIPEVKKSEVVSSIQEEDDIFVCIKASELSLNDEFMQYQPKIEIEKKFKYLLKEVIKEGIADFWRPRMDPSIEQGKICFKLGMEPAVGKSCQWWRDNAKKFNPKRNSRLGTKSQYIAFLGVLIKTLVAEGWNIDEAWYAVCNDSKELGHYKNSENAKYEFEPTGSRVIAGFYDLANTNKILEEDEEDKTSYCVLFANGEYKEDYGFWFGSGDCFTRSYCGYLAYLGHDDRWYCDLDMSVGWLVLS